VVGSWTQARLVTWPPIIVYCTLVSPEMAPTPSPAPAPTSVSAPPLEPHRPVTRTAAGVILQVSYWNLSATTSSLTPSPIPTNYPSALADANWRATMKDENQALIDNGTWRLVPRPPGANVVTGKCIYTRTYHSDVDGTLSCHNAHWVVRSNNQQASIDYDETISPVVKPATIWTMLSLATSRAWCLHQLEVKCFSSWSP
jgi:hypothetical protein